MLLYRIILSTYTVISLLVQKKLASAQAIKSPIPTTNQVFGANTTLKNNFGSISQIITFAFNFVVAIAGVIFIIMMLVGGIQYLTAAGNEESLGKAKGTMIQSIVGLIVVLSSWAIGTWILGSVGIKSNEDVGGGGGGGAIDQFCALNPDNAACL